VSAASMPRIRCENSVTLVPSVSLGASQHGQSKSTRPFPNIDPPSPAMKISESLLGILRCPETRQPLVLANANQIAAIQDALPGENITEALVREDKLAAYPIDDGYPVLLLDRQLRRSGGAAW
jgi:uncharacterized protein YbaR (Trm112 family)